MNKLIKLLEDYPENFIFTLGYDIQCEYVCKLEFMKATTIINSIIPNEVHYGFASTIEEAIDIAVTNYEKG